MQRHFCVLLSLCEFISILRIPHGMQLVQRSFTGPFQSYAPRTGCNAGETIYHSPTWISILRTPHGMQRHFFVLLSLCEFISILRIPHGMQLVQRSFTGPFQSYAPRTGCNAGETIYHSPTWISILRIPHGMQQVALLQQVASLQFQSYASRTGCNRKYVQLS